MGYGLYFRVMASVKFYLKNPKRGGKLRQDEVSIIAKVTFSAADRFEIPTGERIAPSHWDKLAKEVKRSAIDHVRINAVLSEFKRALLDLYYANREKSFEQFKAIAKATLGKGPIPSADEKKSLSFALDAFIRQYEREKDPKTAANYRVLESKHLAPYLNLPFEKLDWDFFDFLRADLRALKDSTANRVLTRIKTFLSWCGDRAYPVNPDYRKWKIKAHYSDPVSLEWDELKALKETPMVGTVAIARDALVILCLIGTRISDGKRFDTINYFDYTWKFDRQKGRNLKSKELQVQFVGFSQQALMILAKYGMMFPKMSEAKLNRHMKEACHLAGITQKVRYEDWRNSKCTVTYPEKWTLIGTHSGRRTFGTLMQEVMPEGKVMELMGIEDSKTLKRYKGKGNSQLTKQYLIEAGEKLKMASTPKADENQKTG